MLRVRSHCQPGATEAVQAAIAELIGAIDLKGFH